MISAFNKGCHTGFGTRHRIALFILLAAVCGSLCLAGCRPPRRESPTTVATTKAGSPGRAGERPDSEALEAKFRKAEIIWEEKGKRVWVARFKEAVAAQSGESAVVELKGVTASLYRDGKVASTLIAPRIVADSSSREVRAAGGVKVTSAADGSIVQCGQIVWKSREDRLLGSGGVRMARGSMTITASAVTTDAALKKASFSDAEMSME